MNEEERITATMFGQVKRFGVLWPLHCGCGAELKQTWPDAKDFARFAVYDCGVKLIGWCGPTETACVRLCLVPGGTRRG